MSGRILFIATGSMGSLMSEDMDCYQLLTRGYLNRHFHTDLHSFPQVVIVLHLCAGNRREVPSAREDSDVLVQPMVLLIGGHELLKVYCAFQL